MKDFQLTFHSASDQRGLDHKTTTRVRKFLCFFDDPSGKSSFLLEFRWIFSRFRNFSARLSLYDCFVYDHMTIFLSPIYLILLFISHFLQRFSSSPHVKRRSRRKTSQWSWKCWKRFSFSIIYWFQFANTYSAINTLGFFLHLIDKTNLLRSRRMKRSGCISKIDFDKWTVLWDYRVTLASRTVENI